MPKDRRGGRRRRSVPARMSREEAERELSLDTGDAIIEGKTPTKYSNELFSQTYREARQLVGNGAPKGGSYSTLMEEGQQVPSLRALQGVQTLINSEKQNIVMSVRLGVRSIDEANDRLEALAVVQRTLNKDVNFYYELAT